MEKKWNCWQVCTGLSGFIAVVMGAAGAHLAADNAAAALVEKASLYQLIHTLALLWLLNRNGHAAQVARIAFLAGITLFCGSLYLKGFSLASTTFAPAGGTLLILGWIVLAFTRASINNKKA